MLLQNTHLKKKVIIINASGLQHSFSTKDIDSANFISPKEFIQNLVSVNLNFFFVQISSISATFGKEIIPEVGHGQPINFYGQTKLLSELLVQKLSKYIIIILSLISFFVASKGFDILYLFLLADLFCCSFVLTVFYSFYNKKIKESTAYLSIIIGLVGGFLLFPTPNFSKSLLVGILIPKELFVPFISQQLLFLSFVVATFLPFFILKAKKV